MAGRRFAIDAGVLLGIADGSIDVHPSHQLVAPGSLRSQALSQLYRAVRGGEIEAAVARELLERLTEVKVRLLNDRVSRGVAWKIAEEQGWDDTADAEYAAITRLQADAFVTRDVRRARRLEGIVPLADVAALRG